MKAKLLGSAAGGGLPQWNCHCRNCNNARAGQIPSRSQSSVAFSEDGSAWFLVNASPDIRYQLPRLQSGESGVGRAKAFEAILFSNADLDHTLGLMIVREGGPVSAYCTEDVRATISASLGFDRLLAAFEGKGSPGIRWRIVGEDPIELALADGAPSGLRLKTLMLGGAPPRYDVSEAGGTGHACAFTIESIATGSRLVCALDVPGQNDALVEEIRNADLAIVDGTFWSDREMIDLGFSSRTAADMGHWPISGPGGSLEAVTALLQDTPIACRTLELGTPASAPISTVSQVKLHLRDSREQIIVYSHINNTNPILEPGSSERAEVEALGLVIGEDGMEWSI